MSKTDDYIIDKHNREIEEIEEQEKTEEELKKEELERELRLDVWE